MKIISIINQKGGVGKTTTALNLSTALRKKNKKILLVDLDPQCNLSNTVNATAKNNIYDVLTGKISLSEAIEADFISSSPYMANLNNKTQFTIIKSKTDYDYIILDTPPSLGIITLNALSITDNIIITTTADAYSLQGINQLITTILAIKQKRNPNIKIKGILLTRFIARTVISKNIITVLEGLTKQLGTKVFNTKIRECIALREAQMLNKDIFSYARYSNGAFDYEKLAGEVLDEKQ